MRAWQLERMNHRDDNGESKKAMNKMDSVYIYVYMYLFPLNNPKKMFFQFYLGDRSSVPLDRDELSAAPNEEMS